MGRPRYHAIPVDGPDDTPTTGVDAAVMDPQTGDDRAPEDLGSFLPDKPLRVPVMTPPGQPPQTGPAPVPPPSDAPLGAELDLPDKPSKLADVYNAVSRTDPDRAAKVLAIQKRMNAPADFIDKNLPDIEKSEAAPSIADWRDIETKLPGTAKFLSQPQNMAIAQDDIQNLAQHEMLLNHGAKEQSLWDSYKAGLQGSVMGLQIRNKLPDLTLPEHADMLHSLAAMAGGITGDFPAMVVGGVAGTAAAGPLGSTAGAFALPAAVKTYQKQQITQGDVQDFPDLMSRTGQVLKEASKQGIVGLATGAAGALAKPLAEIGGVYLPTMASKALGTAAPLAAESAAMEVAGKGVEGQMPSARGVAENLLMVGAMHGAVTPAIGHVGRYLGIAVDAAKAQAAKAGYLAQGETAAASKILPRNPDTYQAHVAELAKDAPDRFIEPEAFNTYFQSKGIDPDQAAAELGLTSELNESKETGNPIRIPIATLLTKLSKSEHYAALADDIKTSPDAPSVRQVQEAQADAKAGVESVLKGHEDAAKAADQEAQVAAESPQYRDIYDKLAAAGVTHGEAHANATVYDETMKALAARTGKTPEEMAAQFPVNVQSAEAPVSGEPVEGAAQSYDQDDTAARGRIRIGKQGSLVDLFKGQANESTPLHEFGHYYLNVMDSLSKEAGAPDDIVSDMKTARDWMGLKDGEEIGREHHEKWARGTEAFFREGNAPSRALEVAFRNFKKWLTTLYRKASSLNVTITPAIRDVMSRMMASEDAVKSAASESGYAPEEIADATPEQKERIRTLSERARDIAEAQLLKEQMPELKAKHQEFLAKERVRLTGEARDAVGELPVFKAGAEAVEKITKLKAPDAIAERFLSEKLKAPEQASFEAIAEVHGFASGEDLAHQIILAHEGGLFDREVKARVDQGMEAHADLKDTAKLREEALRAIHNDKMTELLALEHEALSQLIEKKLTAGEVSRRKRIDASATAAAVKDQARAILQDKPVKDATAHRTYITAERNAAVRAAKAIAAGDYEKATEYKRQQMLNNALAREAIRNKEIADKSEAFLHKYADRGRDQMDMPYGFIRQIDGALTLAGYRDAKPEDSATLLKIATDMRSKGETASDIANATGYISDPKSGGFKQEKLSDLVERLNSGEDGPGYAVTLPDSVMNAGPREADSLTMKDLSELHAAVGIIADIGKKFDRYLGDYKQADIKQASKDFRASVTENYGQPRAADLGPGSQHETKLDALIETARRLPGTLAAQLDTMLTTCNKLDGLKEGPAKDNIYRPFSEAQSRKWERTRVAMEKLDAQFARHFEPKELAEYKKTRVPIDGRFFTKSEILSMALNWGNEGNRSRLRDGFGWDEGKVQGIFEDHLTERDMNFAQDVWSNLHEDYWSDIVKLETDVNGVTPLGVEASAFQFKGKTYQGGYYPIAYDFDKSIDAFKNAEQKSALYKQFGTAKAYTDSGHTEARVAYVNRPLRLSLDVLRNHHEDVIHDLEFRKPVIDVSRFLNQKDTKAALAGALGVQGYSAITDWVKAVAGGNSEPITLGDSVARWFRFKAVFYNLAYRLASTPKIAVENLVNISSELGVSGAARALKSYYFDQTGMHDTVIEKSEFMRQRANHLDRDLADISRKWQGDAGGTPLKDAKIWFDRHAFFIHAYLDQGTSFPLWGDVYARAMADHGDERLAVNQADESVKNTFMSGGGVDQSAIMRGGEKQKLLTTAYGYSSMMWNRFSQSKFAVGRAIDQNDPVGAAAIAARAFVYQFGMPAAVATLSAALLHNGPPGASDPDRKKRLISKVIEEGTPLKFIPVLRDVAPWFIKGVAGEHAQGIHFTPLDEAATTLLTPAVEAGARVFGKPLPPKFGEHSANAVSLLSGFPKQMNDQVFNFLDWQTHNGQATWRDAISRKAKR